VALEGELVDGAEVAEALSEAGDLGARRLGVEAAVVAGGVGEAGGGLVDGHAVVLLEALGDGVLARDDLGEAEVGAVLSAEGLVALVAEAADELLGVGDEGAGLEEVPLGLGDGALEGVGAGALGVEAGGEVVLGVVGAGEGGREPLGLLGAGGGAALELLQPAGDPLAVAAEGVGGVPGVDEGEAGLGVGVLGGAPAGVGGLGVGLGGVAAGGGVAGPGGLGVGGGLEVVRLGLVVPRGAEGFQALGEAGALGLGGLEPGAGAGGGVAGGVAGGAGLLGGRLGGGDVGGVEGGAGGLGGGLGLRQPRLGGLQRRAH